MVVCCCAPKLQKEISKYILAVCALMFTESPEGWLEKTFVQLRPFYVIGVDISEKNALSLQLNSPEVPYR